jgi:hypothetical protein
MESFLSSLRNNNSYQVFIGSYENYNYNLNIKTDKIKKIKKNLNKFKNIKYKQKNIKFKNLINETIIVNNETLESSYKYNIKFENVYNNLIFVKENIIESNKLSLPNVNDNFESFDVNLFTYNDIKIKFLKQKLLNDKDINILKINFFLKKDNYNEILTFLQNFDELILKLQI